MAPTVGRIVLVRSPAFQHECPAIVVRSYVGVSELYCDVRVFTQDEEPPLHLKGIGPQADSSEKWGWRWPPREGTETPAPPPLIPHEDYGPSHPHTPALSVEEQLAKV